MSDMEWRCLCVTTSVTPGIPDSRLLLHAKAAPLRMQCMQDVSKYTAPYQLIRVGWAR
jgi:hypothetical protein